MLLDVIMWYVVLDVIMYRGVSRCYF